MHIVAGLALTGKGLILGITNKMADVEYVIVQDAF